MLERSFGRKPAQTEKLRAIKEWTREALRLPVETAVLVSELECKEAGCPPLETIIAVLCGPQQRIERKLHIAVAELTREAVLQLFEIEARHGT
jgi:hypothetical protein